MGGASFRGEGKGRQGKRSNGVVRKKGNQKVVSQEILKRSSKKHKINDLITRSQESRKEGSSARTGFQELETK